jgi:hypothetical protein
MVFAALLAANAERGSLKADGKQASRKKSKSSLRSHEDMPSSEYIFSEEDLPAPTPAAPDLRELNNCLEALAAVFPTIQLEVFREMLANFDGESRLALVADALLKNHAAWVKGRWRVVDQSVSGRSTATAATAAAEVGVRSSSGVLPGTQQSLVPATEVFRSQEYKDAVKTLAAQEFKGLSRSTIRAVLAESNFNYLEARRTLVHLSSKSWRFALSSLFTRRKAVSSAEAEKQHPLVSWRQAHGASPVAVPCLKQTGCSELDRELFEQLIIPLHRRAKQAQEQADHALATSLNSQEAEEQGASHDCACCFTSAPFEAFTSCDRSGHMVCFRCVQHSISEAVFGQGWQRSIDPRSGTLRCPAVDSSDCAGTIASHHIRRALSDQEDGKGADLVDKFDGRLAEASLLASGLPLVRCPFCDYAEVDDIYLPGNEAQLQVHVHNAYNLVFLLLCMGVVPFLLPFLLLSALAAILASSKRTVGDYLVAQFRLSVARARRRRRGPKFACQSPRCGAASCMACHKAWVDMHICHESSLVALRTRVEQAMSMAIKRVCPRCSTSFVKTAGCNKLTCPCGYKMCYVCRRDIGGSGDGPDVGYRHFCEHFRPDADSAAPCAQCTKCNLWEAEDEEAVLRQAQEEAERKWKEEEQRELSEGERAFLESGIAVRRSPSRKHQFGGLLLLGRKWPSVADLCDLVVENLFM